MKTMGPAVYHSFTSDLQVLKLSHNLPSLSACVVHLSKLNTLRSLHLRVPALDYVKYEAMFWKCDWPPVHQGFTALNQGFSCLTTLHVRNTFRICVCNTPEQPVQGDHCSRGILGNGDHVLQDLCLEFPWPYAQALAPQLPELSQLQLLRLQLCHSDDTQPSRHALWRAIRALPLRHGAVIISGLPTSSTANHCRTDIMEVNPEPTTARAKAIAEDMQNLKAYRTAVEAVEQMAAEQEAHRLSLMDSRAPTGCIFGTRGNVPYVPREQHAQQQMMRNEREMRNHMGASLAAPPFRPAQQHLVPGMPPGSHRPQPPQSPHAGNTTAVRRPLAVCHSPNEFCAQDPVILPPPASYLYQVNAMPAWPCYAQSHVPPPAQPGPWPPMQTPLWPALHQQLPAPEQSQPWPLMRHMPRPPVQHMPVQVSQHWPRPPPQQQMRVTNVGRRGAAHPPLREAARERNRPPNCSRASPRRVSPHPPPSAAAYTPVMHATEQPMGRQHANMHFQDDLSQFERRHACLLRNPDDNGLMFSRINRARSSDALSDVALRSAEAALARPETNLSHGSHVSVNAPDEWLQRRSSASLPGSKTSAFEFHNTPQSSLWPPVGFQSRAPCGTGAF